MPLSRSGVLLSFTKSPPLLDDVPVESSYANAESSPGPGLDDSIRKGWEFLLRQSVHPLENPLGLEVVDLLSMVLVEEELQAGELRPPCLRGVTKAGRA